MGGAPLRLLVGKGRSLVTFALVAPIPPTPRKLMNPKVPSLFCFALVLLLNSGCSGREAPSTFPESSPASLSAAEGRPMRVTRALDEHPPLPSEDTQGWKGLRPAENAKTQEHDHDAHAEHADHTAHEKAPSSAEKPPAAPKEHDHTGHEAPAQEDSAASYSCPMHPEVVSDKPGRCPKCGMNLEKKR